jgi:hypothetical protein
VLSLVAFTLAAFSSTLPAAALAKHKQAPAAVSSVGGIVSLVGQIGAVTLGLTTATELRERVGRPQAEAEDNFQLPEVPQYTALGYGCSDRPGSDRRTLTYYDVSGGPYCRTVYYVNQGTEALGSFWTSSWSFHTSHGTHVGVTQQTASRRERRAARAGCLSGIFLASRAATIHIGITGGRFQSGGQGQPDRLVGGRVFELGVESRSDGVGLLLC